MKINEVAKLANTTIRTLHYYDQIGLLKPTSLSPTGYRIYDEHNLARLQEILFFRELDFPLAEICELMQSPDYDRRAALTRHRELLLKKRTRLDGLIALVEQSLNGESTMSFKEFDTTAIDSARNEYAQEARERWGSTAAYRESERKSAAYDASKWSDISDESAEIFSAFAALRGAAPGAEAAQSLVERWRQHITRNFYDCTLEILSGLGRIYAADARFTQSIDQHGAGTAALMSAAIAAYCEMNAQ